MTNRPAEQKTPIHYAFGRPATVNDPVIHQTTPNDISVTPEMVKAGARTYARADERVQSDEEIVIEIYQAMEAARAK